MPPLFRTLQSLILASSSPRRREMLSRLGIRFEVIPAQADETPLAGEQPADFVRRMARTKAGPVAAEHPGSWVIGADTVVCLYGDILGKPKDHADALTILKKLVGRTHQVMTGICLCCAGRDFEITQVETTGVTFITVNDDVLHSYIRTGEPRDKAGAYGIQGVGTFLVREIEGSCSNVIGLPVDSIILLLLRQQVIVPFL